MEIVRDKSPENLRPDRSAHPRGRGRFGWAGTVVASLAVLACAQTAEAPSIPIQPDLFVTFKAGTFLNAIDGMPYGDELKVRITCPTGTTFFEASELRSSRYKEYDDYPRGAQLASGTFNNDEGLKLEEFYLNMYPNAATEFEGNLVLDCFDGREGDSRETRMGRYQIIAKP